MGVTTRKVVAVGSLLCGLLTVVGCHGRTPQELETLMNEQAHKVWAFRPAAGTSPATYSKCHVPTPTDPRRSDGQPFEAICTERSSHFTSFGGNECFPWNDERTVGLFDEGQSPIARLVAGGPVLQFAYLTNFRPPTLADAAVARSRHTMQQCPQSRGRSGSGH